MKLFAKHLSKNRDWTGRRKRLFPFLPVRQVQFLSLMSVSLGIHFLATVAVMAEVPGRVRPALAPDWMLPAKPPTLGPQYKIENERRPGDVPEPEQKGAVEKLPDLGPGLPAGLLVWDAEEKKTEVTRGTTRTSFTFGVRNVSREPVIVTAMRSTCGCTIPKLPEKMPWTLAPGSRHEIVVVMELAGKRGAVDKSVALITDHGWKSLGVRVDITEPPAAENNRERNLQLAMANRQSVLQGSCAACHATPAVGKMGAELFQNACAICHESEQRAASVPDLRKLAKPADAAHWRAWITTSVEGKLMPAFAIEHGGILTREQIDSLVAYLTRAIPASLPSPESVSTTLKSATP
jgi:mono/diheme cytochrome c family protein